MEKHNLFPSMETRKFKGFKKKFRTAWVEDSFAFEKEQGRQIKY